MPKRLRTEEFEKKRESSELAESDLVASFVAQYNRELEWGLRLYDELLELKAKSLDGKSTLTLKIGENHLSDFSVNEYVYEMRRKYWEKFFGEPRFFGKLTSNLQYEYISQVHEFANYDFSYWNIKTVQEEIARSLVKGVEDCIIELFDELSYRHSYDEELSHNIHYYTGWKTNIAWKINRRVIIPLRSFGTYSDGTHFKTYLVQHKLSDIEKVLNYLDNGETGSVNIENQLWDAERTRIFRNIQLKYFDVTFYKKGTCHLTFRNERLLKKFNIFGSQRKGWLPKGYARKKYAEFNEEERAVIDSFEGQESYEQTQSEPQYFLFKTNMPMLTA